MAEYRIINIVYVKLQGSGATSKYYPIAMNFCTIFFYTIGTDWKGAPLTFQTFIFVPDVMGHPSLYVTITDTITDYMQTLSYAITMTILPSVSKSAIAASL